MDWPGATFYERLMERYPGAKVTLTVRDPDRWYESARNTIYNIRRIASSPPFSFLALFVPQIRRMRRAALMAGDLVWEGVFGGKFEDRRYAIEVFDRWNEEVERRVPAGKLLVYQVSEGWEPLCEFLGVEKPDKPFPHLNEAGAFRKTIRHYMVFVLVALIGGLSLTVLAFLRLRQRSKHRQRTHR